MLNTIKTAIAALVMITGPAFAQIVELEVDRFWSDLGVTTVQAVYSSQQDFVTVIYEGPVTIEAVETVEFYYTEARQNGYSDLNLRITSNGGEVFGGGYLAELNIYYDVDVHVPDYCYSACANAFIAGNDRIIGTDAVVGFHATWYEDEVGRAHCIGHNDEEYELFAEIYANSFNPNWDLDDAEIIWDIQMNYCNPDGFLKFYKDSWITRK